MHAELDLAFRQVRLELLGEEPFATDRGQRFVDPLVAGRAVRLELTHDAPRLEASLHLPRLTERELRCARGDDQRGPRRARHQPVSEATRKCRAIASTRP